MHERTTLLVGVKKGIEHNSVTPEWFKTDYVNYFSNHPRMNWPLERDLLHENDNGLIIFYHDPEIKNANADK